MPRRIRVVLLATLVMGTCSYMAIPLLAIYLRSWVQMPGWQIATVLSVNLIVGRVLPLLGGLLADRTTHGISMVVGMVLRALGFLGFAWGRGFPMMVACAAIVGLGGALYEPAVSALFALQPEVGRRRSFTYFNQAINAGAIVGPAVGSVLWRIGSRAPLLLAASVVSLLALVLMREPELHALRSRVSPLTTSLRVVFSDAGFLWFMAGMSLFYIVFFQLYYSFPIECLRRGYSESMTAGLFVLNGSTGLVAMFLFRSVMVRNPPVTLVRSGVLLVAVAMALVPMVPTLIWMALCIGLFSLGETIAFSAAEMHVAGIAGAQATGTYFGAFQIAIALGGTIGAYAGSALMGMPGHRYLPWLTYAGLCVLQVFVLAGVSRWVPGSTPQGRVS